MIAFGFFKGLPHKHSTEDFDAYKQYKNQIAKNKVIMHIESLERWNTSLPSYDMFTGEPLDAGIYKDGEFVFPLEFLHFYKKYDIGIPPHYEEYLQTVLN